MPWVAATQAAISGSRTRPCCVYELPEKPVPCSLSYTAARNERGVESLATSVAVMPRLRARSQPTRSLERATTRAR